MTAPGIIVPTEVLVWTESIPTTVSALLNGLVRDLCVAWFLLTTIGLPV